MEWSESRKRHLPQEGGVCLFSKEGGHNDYAESGHEYYVC